MKKSYLLGTLCTLSVLNFQSAYANSIPIVFAGEDQTYFIGDSAHLEATATDADGDAMVGWQWAVEESPAGSDPILATELSSTTGFNTETVGDYVVSVVAYDGLDWSLPDTVTITYVLNLAPTAVATASPTSGTTPLTVLFDATQSFDPEGADLLYLWNFGDGTPYSLDPITSHTYEYSGIPYIAQLKVEDDRGQVAYATIEINVSAVPVPAAVWLFSSGLIGLIGIARRKKA